MYKSVTTFVVGAGASLELGFPTSNTLKEHIAKAVNIRFDHGVRPIHGDPAVAEALRQHADYNKGQHEEYNANIQAGWHISKAMPQAISIDNFVENQEDECVTRMAKLGIASCLIDAEQACWKSFREDDHSRNISWNKFTKNWIQAFQQTLTEGTKKSSISSIFDGLTFIVFNYDRSLEFFLSHSLSNYYGLTFDEACGIVSAAEFFHPYGQIGKLPWQKADLPSLEFGSGDKRNLFQISQSILTFSEQISDGDQLALIRERINNAEQLVFLGFAFHPSNMTLLQPERYSNTLRVLATAYQISEFDCDVILNQIAYLCLTGQSMNEWAPGEATDRLPDGQLIRFILDNKATCSSLFETYRRTLIG